MAAPSRPEPAAPAAPCSRARLAMTMLVVLLLLLVPLRDRHDVAPSSCRANDGRSTELTCASYAVLRVVAGVGAAAVVVVEHEREGAALVAALIAGLLAASGRRSRRGVDVDDPVPARPPGVVPLRRGPPAVAA